LPIRHAGPAGQAPNNSNEAKIAVAALTVVKFIYSEKTKKIEEISLLVFDMS